MIQSDFARLESETTAAESEAVRTFDEFIGKAVEVSRTLTSEICPTVVQVGANVTLEDCEDTLHQVVGKAQQLFAYPVSDGTVPDKTEVRNFFSKAVVNKTVIVGHLCGKFGTFLFSSCMRAMQGDWCDCEFLAIAH